VYVDRLDRAILNAVQREFPLSARPYEALARTLNADAGDVFRRVCRLRREGFIRRIGPLFNTQELGRRGRLVAVHAGPEAIDSLAALLADCPEVTHNYLRRSRGSQSCRFNVWFTVSVDEQDDVERVLKPVRDCPGVSEVRAFLARKVFKLNASFEPGGGDD
jgi:DNA-binding Lrp family transcriptional regulator